jgi:tetratricopeptide (TPR) repeat protein
MRTDRYGLPLSTTSCAARDAYVAGADCVLAGTEGYREHLARAIAEDPDFALAHTALARGLFLDGEVKAAREGVAEARELVAGATPRERSHVNALALAIEGKIPDSLAATREHLVEHPRDAMVLAPATGVFGLIGFSGRAEREEELDDWMQSLAPQFGEDWWFDSMLAFSACERGRLDEAWRLIDRSIAAFPANAHGVHVGAHVLHEKGETAACFGYLDARLPSFDRRSLLHCHLAWHLALSALALGKSDLAWETFTSMVKPPSSWGPTLNVMSDTISFLWRAELAGEPRRADLWREARDYALSCFPKAGVFFADVHTAIACVANEDFAGLDKLVGEMRARLEAGKLPPGRVVPLLADAFAAYAREDWPRAVALLEDALPEVVRIGGSRAQRDLVADTLLAAYLKSGRVDDARALIARRTGRHPPIGVAGLAARLG